MPSARPSPVPTSSPSDACSSSSEYRYKMILTDSGGDGWGGATFQISTDSTLRFSGTLATGMQREALLSPLPSQCPTPPRSPPISPPGSYAVEYFCLEDGEHTVVVMPRVVPVWPPQSDHVNGMILTISEYQSSTCDPSNIMSCNLSQSTWHRLSGAHVI